ncbi:hypothetical protein AAF712_008349 [Marasmius tenuissimus]|uniref:Chromo shadow domain-containing protein n=1 Tax=Marasmius tenuissimus TaxID=585030 RepID=A0ABR2ZFV1_9AGAR|nr:hypothetical protein PM082_001897 [Marasmius tenuissimus]KAJ8095633.1 hypothetical protein PM082_023040 [Marasmius tenuissimus]KAJ8096058.1 hypothetical protein PM082_022672 [Marasmius tenuissimus]
MSVEHEYPTIDDAETQEKLYDIEHMKVNYGHHTTWDPIVRCVEGILREPKGNGSRTTVYARLNDRGQRKMVCMPLNVARTRLPQKLIAFYEKHLEWLVHPDDESGSDN